MSVVGVGMSSNPISCHFFADMPQADKSLSLRSAKVKIYSRLGYMIKLILKLFFVDQESFLISFIHKNKVKICQNRLLS